MNLTPLEKELQDRSIDEGYELIIHENMDGIVTGLKIGADEIKFQTPIDNDASKFNIIDKECYLFGVYEMPEETVDFFDSLLNKEIRIWSTQDTTKSVGEIIFQTKESSFLISFKYNNDYNILSNTDFHVLNFEQVEFSKFQLNEEEHLKEVIVPSEIRIFSKKFETNSLGETTTRSTAEIAFNLFSETKQCLLSSDSYIGALIKLTTDEDIVNIISDKKLIRNRVVR